MKYWREMCQLQKRFLSKVSCEREGWSREKARTVENCWDCIHAHLNDVGKFHVNQKKSVRQKDVRSIYFLIVLKPLLLYCRLAYITHLLEGTWWTDKTRKDCKGTRIRSLTFPSKPTFTSITQNIGFHDTIIYYIRQMLIQAENPQFADDKFMSKIGKEMRGNRDWNIHCTQTVSKFYTFCSFVFLSESSSAFTQTHNRQG